MNIETLSIQSTLDKTSQPVRVLRANEKNRPLVVALHTWSYDYLQEDRNEYFRRCEERGWNCVFPDFRGASNNPLACGSSSALQDILDAIMWADETMSLDHRRIFLVGESGGGHMALLTAAHSPSSWTAVSAWAPISDLALWHRESCARDLEYSAELEQICGGAPGSSKAVDAEYAKRSPLTSIWRANILPVDINTGIHDGHGGLFGGEGSVPVGHSIRAFNELVKAADKPEDQIPEAIIAYIEKEERIPPDFASGMLEDPLYDRTLHLRRISALSRLTLFEGGHEILYDTAFRWFETF